MNIEQAGEQVERSDQKAKLERLALYLGNIGEAWRHATPEQGNRLAHTLFESLRVEDRAIEGLTPQAEFTPLLVLSHQPRLNGPQQGKKRLTPRLKCQPTMYRRKRRGSNPHDRFNLQTHKLYEQQEIVDPLALHLHSKEQAPLGRYTKLLNRIPQEVSHEVARRHSGGDSLRQLALWYGVSQEAVRQVLKRYGNEPSLKYRPSPTVKE